MSATLAHSIAPSVIRQIARPIARPAPLPLTAYLRNRLDVRIPRHGLAIANGHLTYAQGYDRLWWWSWRIGASALPNGEAADLADWLHRKLIASIDYSEDLNARLADALEGHCNAA